jgi:hypothetical protein
MCVVACVLQHVGWCLLAIHLLCVWSPHASHRHVAYVPMVVVICVSPTLHRVEGVGGGEGGEFVRLL